MAAGIEKLDDEWLREQREISDRMNKEHIAKFDRSFYGHMAKFADDERERDDAGTEKRVDHHASTVADLLVESGRFPHRTAALDHLLNSPHGNALLARLHKAEARTGKDHSIMDRATELRAIAKAGGIIAVAKSICDENRSYGITEHEFVELATEHAKAAHPELTEAAAFAKLYENPAIWRACNVLKKSMPFVADITPLVVGGVDATHEAINSTESSEAYAQLQQIGRDRWPTASEARQFANAFSENATLAAKAHRRPTAPPGGAYPFPR